MIPTRSRTIEYSEESSFLGPIHGVDIFVAMRFTRYDFRMIGVSSRNGTSLIFLQCRSLVILMLLGS